MRLWLVAVSLMASQAAAQPSGSAFAPRPITDAEKEAFSTYIAGKLKDPESARFRWNPEIRDNAIYCGFVNAKNSYGGYTGFKPYMLFIGLRADGSVAPLMFKADKGPVHTSRGQFVGESAEAQMCKGRGYNMDPDAAP